MISGHYNYWIIEAVHIVIDEEYFVSLVKLYFIGFHSTVFFKSVIQEIHWGIFADVTHIGHKVLVFLYLWKVHTFIYGNNKSFYGAEQK